MLISTQAARPRRGGSGELRQPVAVDQGVGVRSGHSVGRFAKLAAFDADALLNEDDSYNVDACLALLAKWQGELDLLDAAEKVGENYTLKWGGKQVDVLSGFCRVTGCDQKDPETGDRLTKGPLMRHFIAFLRERIAETQSGDEGSN